MGKTVKAVKKGQTHCKCNTYRYNTGATLPRGKKATYRKLKHPDTVSEFIYIYICTGIYIGNNITTKDVKK